ncbi:MAG: beta-1,6-N-acetylglucosaminyltransferase [Clostridia bacterium]|nr:beta-1,6-N-acetylglucosaminyltransferase [Clostridia bacterium]
MILAHKNPQQLCRLISSLNNPDIKIYVNIDLKSEIEANVNQKNVFYVSNRVKVYWGTYSLVQMILSGLVEITEKEKTFNHLILISGEDYPLWTNDQIVAFSEANINHEFIEYTTLDENGWIGARKRFEHIYHNGTSIVCTTFFRVINKLFDLIKYYRPFYDGLKPFGGSVWWMLSKSAINHILQFVELNPNFTKYMRSVRCPDEIFFQTILCNSVFQRSIINNNYRYISWETCKKGLSSNPDYLTYEDLDNIWESGKMFMRKVSLENSSHLMDTVDCLRRNKENQFNEGFKEIN